MDLLTPCALVPPLCRIARDPVLMPLAARCLHAQDPRPLAEALLQRHPELARETLEAAGLSAEHALCQLLQEPVLSYLHVFGQCPAGELLTALSSRTVTPTPEGLALLLNHRRQRDAQWQYALRLLWRMSGGAPWPDPAAIGAAAPPHSPSDP